MRPASRRRRRIRRGRDSSEHGGIQTPFGPYSTAAEVASSIELARNRVIVTGDSSGLGMETARALASAGAAVTLAVRNTEAGAATVPTGASKRDTSADP